jgi:hypothetical protein
MAVFLDWVVHGGPGRWVGLRRIVSARQCLPLGRFGHAQAVEKPAVVQGLPGFVNGRAEIAGRPAGNMPATVAQGLLWLR